MYGYEDLTVFYSFSSITLSSSFLTKLLNIINTPNPYLREDSLVFVSSTIIIDKISKYLLSLTISCIEITHLHFDNRYLIYNSLYDLKQLLSSM